MKPLSLSVSPRSKRVKQDRVTVAMGRKNVVFSPAQAVRLAVVILTKVDPQNVEQFAGVIA